MAKRFNFLKKEDRAEWREAVRSNANRDFNEGLFKAGSKVREGVKKAIAGDARRMAETRGKGRRGR